MKKIIYVFAATAMLLFGSSKLQAQCNIEQSTAFYIRSLGAGGENQLGQSFVATCSGSIDVIKLNGDVTRNGNTNSGQLTIYNGNGTSGTVIYDQPFSVVQSGGFTTIPLIAGASVTAGNSYTFSITNGNGFVFYFYWESYSGGGLFLNGGNYTGSYDLAFNVHITNAVTCIKTSTTAVSICQGSSYNFNGTSYNTAGTYVAHITTSTGCDSAATLNLSVINSLPTITGPSSVCVGSSIALSNAISGGVWSSIAGRATVNASGVVTGQSVGSLATIKYTYRNNGCNLSTTKNITVNAIPATPSIGYKAPFSNPQQGAPYQGFCVGKVFGVAGSPSGGVWSTAGCISVTTGGIATINTTGAGSLTYTYTNVNGCVNSRTMAGAGYTCAARGVAVNGESVMVNVKTTDFALFPNPAKSILNLKVENLVGEGQIIVTDLYGKTVKSQPLSMGNNTVDIANLSKGFYLVSTITSEGKTTKKLVVE